ncbi:hypothetical protein V2J09_016301 [Rumex salicifolius]
MVKIKVVHLCFLFPSNKKSYICQQNRRIEFGNMLAEPSDGIFSKDSRFESASIRSNDEFGAFHNKSDALSSGDSVVLSSSRTINSSFSPTSRSPWACQIRPLDFDDSMYGRLLGSLVREEGHIYSLAACGDLLYTGSDSKNIRVWKNKKEYSGFKSNSGLVKSIVIAGGKQIFTGHQDGKIRVWKASSKNARVHKRIGTLPTFKAVIKSSIRPGPWITHLDAISSLSLSEDGTLLYSGSWDRMVKVWRVSNFKYLESISAHDDAVNAVISGFDGFVFTGSADGSVKVWRREMQMQGKGTKHYFSQTLLKQECAITALAVDPAATTLYCGSSDGAVYFWDRHNFSSISGHLGAHNLAVLCLSTADTLVLSGSADMNICIWKRDGAGPNNHVFLSMLTGHNGPVKCLAVQRDKAAAPDDEPTWILYSGSLDKSVKIWQINSHPPI